MKIVQQQEWIQLRKLVKTESAPQVNAGAFDGRLRFPDLTDFSYGIHDGNITLRCKACCFGGTKTLKDRRPSRALGKCAAGCRFGVSFTFG
jgi:hypothetical protein